MYNMEIVTKKRNMWFQQGVIDYSTILNLFEKQTLKSFWLSYSMGLEVFSVIGFCDCKNNFPSSSNFSEFQVKFVHVQGVSSRERGRHCRIWNLSRVLFKVCGAVPSKIGIYCISMRARKRLGMLSNIFDYPQFDSVSNLCVMKS